MSWGLVWNPQALADRMAIMEYIAQDNPVAAVELDELIEQKAEGLTENPKLYRAGRMAGTRDMIVNANYLAVYRLHDADQVVEILRVLHSAQAWPPANKG